MSDDRAATATASPATAAPRAASSASTPQRARFRRLAATAGIAAAVVLLLAFGKATTPAFITYRNFQNIIRAAATTGITALGMTFVTMSGNYFSLSAGETAAFCAIAFSAMISWGWGWGAALLLTLVIAGVIGLLQGGVVAAGGNPIVITLGAGAFLFGLSAVLSGNKTVRVGSTDAEWLGQARPLGIPNQTWAFVLLAVVAAVVLARTRYGRSLTLVGANRASAIATGLRPGRIALSAFAISSLAAGIAGVFTAAQIGQGVTDQFPGLTIDAVAAVLVGGTAVAGGDGSMLRTALGAVFIASLNNLMLLRGYSYGTRILLQGAVILAGVSVFTVLRRRPA